MCSGFSTLVLRFFRPSFLSVLDCSFGVLLWEMLTKKSPHACWLKLLTKKLNRPATIDDIFAPVKAGNRLPLPSDTPSKFAALIRDCWQQEPNKRPDMSNVLLRLTEMLEEERKASGSANVTILISSLYCNHLFSVS